MSNGRNISIEGPRSKRHKTSRHRAVLGVATPSRPVDHRPSYPLPPPPFHELQPPSACETPKADRMAERPSHKRAKSSIHLSSLVHRHKPKPEEDGDESEAGSPVAPTKSLTNYPSSSTGQLSATRSNISTAETLQHTMSNQTSATATPPAPTGLSGMSIDQSVRIFRLFEALRSGDINTISRAIRESSSRTSIDGSERAAGGGLEGTTVLHLAVQCAEPQVVEYVLSAGVPDFDVNARDRDGNTALHLAARLGRAQIVRQLLDQQGINDSLANYQGQTPLDVARTPEIFEQLQLSRSLFIDSKVRQVHELVAQGSYDELEMLLVDSRVETVLDVNGLELVTDPTTTHSGGTLLHEAARKKDIKLIQLLLMHGADPFRRDRRGKLPQDVIKDDKTRAILKKSPAAVAAQRGIQEKAILGNAPASRESTSGPGDSLAGKESREMKGYLKKWTNYTSGYKLRWFVLEDGVMSYYKHQDDAGSACRGAINMRIARLHMDPQDKTRFEIHGKSSVKYHLKANHQVEAKRWFWALNNAIQWAKDEEKEDERRRNQEAERLKQAKDQAEKQQGEGALESSQSSVSAKVSSRGLMPATSLGIPGTSGSAVPSTIGDDEISPSGSYEPSMVGQDMGRIISNVHTMTIEGDLDADEEYGDDASSHEAQPASKDAFNITAQSARMQLDILSHICAAIEAEKDRDPQKPISDPSIGKAYGAYKGAIGSLNSLLSDLLKISKDRDAFWQYKLDREADARRMWEDSMARVAKEHEDLQNRIGESEEKRKRTKRALREALEGTTASAGASRAMSPNRSNDNITAATEALEDQLIAQDGSLARSRKSTVTSAGPRKSVIAQFTDLSDSESGEDDEFFDAIDAGEIEVVDELPKSEKTSQPPPEEVSTAIASVWEEKQKDISTSFKGYEEPIRKRLKMDADDRPKISLWVRILARLFHETDILTSMIGYSQVHDWQGYDEDDSSSIFQRANFSSPTCRRRYGVHRSS